MTRTRQKIEVVLFDLDETLYPREAGLMQAIGRRIQSYMEERLGLGAATVSRLRPEYVRQYGTSLRGLQLHHHIDAEDYLAYVHDVPLSEYIGPNPALQEMLHRLPVRKVIFTNATREHALAVTRTLGVEKYFEEIIDIRSCHFHCKPQLEAYRQAIEKLGVEAERCLLVDDNVRNLRPGKQLGMLTVLVGDQPPEPSVVDFHISNVLGVGEIVLHLNTDGKDDQPGEAKADSVTHAP